MVSHGISSPNTGLSSGSPASWSTPRSGDPAWSTFWSPRRRSSIRLSGTSRPKRAAMICRARSSASGVTRIAHPFNGGLDLSFFGLREESFDVVDEEELVTDGENPFDVLDARHDVSRWGDLKLRRAFDARHRVDGNRHGARRRSGDEKLCVDPVRARSEPEPAAEVENRYDLSVHVDDAEAHVRRARQRGDGDHALHPNDRVEGHRIRLGVEPEYDDANGARRCACHGHHHAPRAYHATANSIRYLELFRLCALVHTSAESGGIPAGRDRGGRRAFA